MNLFPVEFDPFLGVLGLTFLFWVTANVIQRYREIQAEKLARLGRLWSGAERIEDALAKLDGLPVPRELTGLFGTELLVRYRALAELVPKMEGLPERLADAQSRIKAGGQDPGWHAPQLNDAAQVYRYMEGLTRMVDILENVSLEERIEPVRARELREKIRVLRAETRWENGRRRILAAGILADWETARKEAVKVIAYLKRRAPRNQRGMALYEEAEALLRLVALRRLPDEEGVR